MKLFNEKLLSGVIAAVAIIWCHAIITAMARLVPPAQIAGGLVFGLIAAAVSILYLLLFRRSPGRQAAEAGAVPICITVAYVVVVLGMNTALLFYGHGGLRLLLLGNMIVNAAYFVWLLYAEKSVRRLSRQLEQTEERLSGTAGLSAKIGDILGMMEDGDLRGRLLRLKEAVDYSTNVTTDSTAEHESRLAGQLEELRELIQNQGEPSAVQAKLQEAELTWKARSNAALSRR